MYDSCDDSFNQIINLMEVSWTLLYMLCFPKIAAIGLKKKYFILNAAAFQTMDETRVHARVYDIYI